MSATTFADLNALATDFRQQLANKKFILLYAYNGVGKTRLSTAFKDIGKQAEQADTLYFNAFTEDLFSWHNDLEGDTERYLILHHHPSSSFFAGLEELEMDTRIRLLLQRYADFDFRLDKISVKNEEGVVIREERIVRFSREVSDGATTTTVDNIKISRGEENIFIWCFFLAIVRLALDDDGTGPYNWVKYIYIDDPISSLDDNNAVMVAHHLAQMLKDTPTRLQGVVMSSHHVLFFNVLCNETKKPRTYFLTREPQAGGFAVRKTNSTPFLYHLASLVELHEAQESGAIFTHHFNMMRRVMEQTACFFGYAKWHECIKPEADDSNGTIYKRVIDLMSHGDYSLYEPREMMQENKDHFRRVLRQFVSLHPFSPALFPSEPTPAPTIAITPTTGQAT